MHQCKSVYVLLINYRDNFVSQLWGERYHSSFSFKEIRSLLPTLFTVLSFHRNPVSPPSNLNRSPNSSHQVMLHFHKYSFFSISSVFTNVLATFCRSRAVRHMHQIPNLGYYNSQLPVITFLSQVNQCSLCMEGSLCLPADLCTTSLEWN